MSSQADASDPVVVTPDLLREWSLPEPASNKHGRGRVVVVGGAAKTPGAIMLSGLAALRAGAGHLTLMVAESTAPHVAVAVPESGVVGLAQTDGGSVRGDALGRCGDVLGEADAVIFGPGLDSAEETRSLLADLSEHVGHETQVVLDAYALGVLGDVAACRDALAGRLTLTPNDEEASRLLERDVTSPGQAVSALSRQFDAVVLLENHVAEAGGNCWQVSAGHPGLATSGSGDVLAGAVGGLLARGTPPPQAGVWATYAHAVAGDRLAVDIGPTGFLARELLGMIPRVLAELS